LENKTVTVTFRMTPTVRELLQKIADDEHRSLSNTVEVLILDRVKKSGLSPDNSPVISKGRKE
jgi:hypothetical protein